MGVPTKDEIDTLTERVEVLTAAIDNLRVTETPKPAAKPAARKPAAKPAAKKAAAKPAAKDRRRRKPPHGPNRTGHSLP